MGDGLSQGFEARAGAILSLIRSKAGVMRYRPEIDGLRAVAVLSVVLFHLGDRVVSCGYVGVDVFFVISGYLITSLIHNEQQRGEFSLISFYVRRIKRIAPALLAVVLVTVALGYLLLPPGDYKLLARSGRLALAGASNFFFRDNTGYFDPQAGTMPLLHTWSLGVEEQFYVVWPGLLIVLASVSRKTKIPVLVFISAIVAASLASFFLVGEKDAFYMPYARAWELGLGAIIALLPEIIGHRFVPFRKILTWLGLVLIGAAMCQFGSATDVAGNRIVAAAVGAGFIVFAIEPKSRVHRVLSSTPLVFVGKISYSLYLWHFPAIVFWRYYFGETVSLAYFASFIVGITALAWLSWRYIEEPCRRAALNWRPVFAGFAGAVLAIGCACWGVVATDGALARIPDSLLPLRSRAVMWEWSCPSWHLVGDQTLCTGGAPWDTAAGHAVIWGDSNASHFMPLLDVAGRQQNVSISIADDFCSPIAAAGYVEYNDVSTLKQCDARQKATLATLRSKGIDLVILSAAWNYVTHYYSMHGGHGDSILRDALERLLPQVAAEGRTVVLMSEIPKWYTDPMPCVLAQQAGLLRNGSFRENCQDAINRFDRSYFLYRQKVADDVIRSFNDRNGIVVWPTADRLCAERLCTTMVENEFIYRDNEHLRRNLSARVKRELAAMLHFGDLMELAKKGATGSAPASPSPGIISGLAPPAAEDLRSRP